MEDLDCFCIVNVLIIPVSFKTYIYFPVGAAISVFFFLAREPIFILFYFQCILLINGFTFKSELASHFCLFVS